MVRLRRLLLRLGLHRHCVLPRRMGHRPHLRLPGPVLRLPAPGRFRPRAAGDKLGRQHIMVLTIVMMTIPTTLIGILPTYATLGAFAPILLLLCRMVQGFSTGGEYGGAAVYMAEPAPVRRRGFRGSFLELGTLAGTATAALVCTILLVLVGSDGMEAGWWRLPFLLTLPLGAVALWLRMKLDDPEAF